MPRQPLLTTIASTRIAACVPAISGPSWTRRTSRTFPRTRPSVVLTVRSRSSLRRTVPVPWDVPDHVVADPSLARPGREVLGVEREVDHGPDAVGQGQRDHGPVPIMVVDELVRPLDPRPDPPAAGALEERAGAGDDRHHVELTLGRALELEVVHVAAQPALAVPELAVEELQPGIEDAAGHPVPPFVMMSSGIVTIETRTR